jgi:hypothetical protein
MLTKTKIFLSSTTHSHRIRIEAWARVLDRLPHLDARATCPNGHRHEFSIPLRCYMPLKIETLSGQSMKLVQEVK